MPKIIILNGVGEGLEYRIKDEAILGRQTSNPIPIQDSKASRQHTRIFSKNGLYYIEDLKSRNGTFVNDELITSTQLFDGDEIQIGETKLVFQSKIQKRSDLSLAETMPLTPIDVNELDTKEKTRVVSDAIDNIPELVQIDLDTEKTLDIDDDFVLSGFRPEDSNAIKKQKISIPQWDKTVSKAVKSSREYKEPPKSKDYLLSTYRNKPKIFSSLSDAFFHSDFSQMAWYFRVLKVCFLIIFVIFITLCSRWITLSLLS